MPAVLTGDFPDNGKTEAATLRGGSGDPVKMFEYLLPLGQRNSRPIVAHIQLRRYLRPRHQKRGDATPS